MSFSAARKMFLAIFSLPLFALCISGCVAVSPEPFEGFEQSVARASDGMEKALADNVEWTKDAFTIEVAEDKGVQFSSLMIRLEDEWDWEWPGEPLCFKLASSSETLCSMNTAFNEYARLLSELAGEKITDPARFDEMAKTLNGNLGKALKNSGMAENADTAIISTAAVASAELFILHRRKKFLSGALKENSKNVANFARSSRTLLGIMRGNLKISYSNAMAALSRKWNSNPENRESLARKALEINREFLDSLRELKRLDGYYRILPQAHDELAASLDAKNGGTAKIRELRQIAERIGKIYSKSKKTDTEKQ